MRNEGDRVSEVEEPKPKMGRVMSRSGAGAAYDARRNEAGMSGRGRVVVVK